MRHWCVIGLIILLAGQPLADHAAMSAVTLSTHRSSHLAL